MTANGLAAAAGWVLDQVLGEPPARWHPVAGFGGAMRRLEGITYRDRRRAGVVHVAVGVGASGAAGAALQRLVGRTAATVVATTVAIAGRMLAAEARAVLVAVDDGDLLRARDRLRGLVGRDVDGLDAGGITRAVIESLAENTVDAVTAPLWWATVGGAPAVLAHRAVNTLDAMIGHRTERYERFGWAAARTDDAANWVPARLAAVGIAALHPARAGAVLTTVRRDAPQHPSPNGGVVEAAFAAALDVRLGGSNSYRGVVEDRGALGSGRPPTTPDGARAADLATRLGALTAAAAAVCSIVASSRRRTAATRTPSRPPGVG